MVTQLRSSLCGVIVFAFGILLSVVVFKGGFEFEFWVSSYFTFIHVHTLTVHLKTQTQLENCKLRQLRMTEINLPFVTINVTMFSSLSRNKDPPAIQPKVLAHTTPAKLDGK